MSAAERDLEILRAFEPVVRYTKGEKFFPMDVGPYVEACSLWLQVPDGTDLEIVPEGELDLERLVELRDASFGPIFYPPFRAPPRPSEGAPGFAGEPRARKGPTSEV